MYHFDVTGHYLCTIYLSCVILWTCAPRPPFAMCVPGSNYAITLIIAHAHNTSIRSMLHSQSDVQVIMTGTLNPIKCTIHYLLVYLIPPCNSIMMGPSNLLKSRCIYIQNLDTDILDMYYDITATYL